MINKEGFQQIFIPELLNIFGKYPHKIILNAELLPEKETALINTTSNNDIIIMETVISFKTKN